jgi:hypothetical protein
MARVRGLGTSDPKPDPVVGYFEMDAELRVALKTRIFISSVETISFSTYSAPYS